MKKILCLGIGLVLMIVSIQGISATSTVTTGKNILNPDDVTYTEAGFYSTAGITVTPSTTYVFSMPSNDYVHDVFITIESREGTLIETLNDGSNGCVDAGDTFYCAFTTSATTTEIQINGSTSSPDMKRYFDWIGSMRMQIEEGSTFTGYEPYTVYDTDAPEFQGNGLLVTSYDTVLTLDTIISNHISAYDTIDGDVSSDIYVISDAYTGYEQDVGDYLVVLGVQDSSNNVAEFNLTIRVKDEIAPLIDGPSTLTVDVNNPPTIDALITNHFVLHDDYDGAISSYTVIEDTYTPHTTVLGTKTVRFSITDASTNVTEHTLSIDIQDTEAPVITSPASIEWVLSTAYTETDLLQYVSAADNHTEASGITLQVHSHTLPTNFDIPGDYTVTYHALDASLNETLVTVPITIRDDIKPQLTGPEMVETSYESPLTLDAIKALLTVSDNYKSLTISDVSVLSNSYHSLETHVPGMYQIVFHVSDTENIDTHTLYVHVVDDVAPTFAFDEHIMIESGSTLSHDDMLLMLLKDADIQAFDPIALEIKDTVKDNNLTYYTVVLRNAEDATVERIIPVETITPVRPSTPPIVTPLRIVLSFTALITCIILVKRFKR